jgi:hypothetical protein
MHYANYVVFCICETCEFYYCPSQSFECQHKIVNKVFKILNIKILEIQKKVIVPLGTLQSSYLKFSYLHRLLRVLQAF